MTVGDWRSELRLKLEDFVDSFVVAGARPEDVCDAILEEIGSLRTAQGKDPGSSGRSSRC